MSLASLRQMVGFGAVVYLGGTPPLLMGKEEMGFIGDCKKSWGYGSYFGILLEQKSWGYGRRWHRALGSRLPPRPSSPPAYPGSSPPRSSSPVSGHKIIIRITEATSALDDKYISTIDEFNLCIFANSSVNPRRNTAAAGGRKAEETTGVVPYLRRSELQSRRVLQLAPQAQASCNRTNACTDKIISNSSRKESAKAMHDRGNELLVATETHLAWKRRSTGGGGEGGRVGRRGGRTAQGAQGPRGAGSRRGAPFFLLARE